MATVARTPAAKEAATSDPDGRRTGSLPDPLWAEVEADPLWVGMGAVAGVVAVVGLGFVVGAVVVGVVVVVVVAVGVGPGGGSEVVGGGDAGVGLVPRVADDGSDTDAGSRRVQPGSIQ